MKDGWTTKSLGEVCDFTNGLWKGEKPPFLTVGVIRNANFTKEGALDDSDIAFIEVEVKKFEKRRLQIGDIILEKSGGGPKQPVGRVVLFDKQDGDFSFSNFTAALRVRDHGEVDFRYLHKFLHWTYLSGVTEAIQSHSTGIRNLNGDAYKAIAFNYPPLPEQQRIVALLDDAFAGLATAKANAERNLQNARALFESHLQAVFTQRGPGWVETTLGEVIKIVGGSQPPKSVFSKIKKLDNIRLIQIRDYKSDNHIVFIPRDLARRFCNADDVMIGRYGPPLFQILRGIEGAYNVALMKAVPDSAKLSRDFLFYFLKHPAILQYVIYHSSRAAGQIGVTKETLEPYPIALPSLPEQMKVVETIQELETLTQRLTHIYERKLAALEELKKTLLHQALSGEF
jgi:type I restriction enzyme, S subunit